MEDIVQDGWRQIDSGTAELVSATKLSIQANSPRLSQLLINLMRNAVEHGGETVVGGDLPDGFSLANDGPGIPEAERDHVYEHGYSTTAEGTGFGLSIVNRIANAHDWNIHLKEIDEGGVRVEITDVER